MVVYGILFGDMHPVLYLSMMCMHIEMFHVSDIALNATMVIYGILFDGMHPHISI